METTLDQLGEGESATVLEVRLPAEMKFRLMEMGMLEGREVRLIRFAPLKDPVEVSVLNSRIAIRRKDAGCIRMIRKNSPGRGFA